MDLDDNMDVENGGDLIQWKRTLILWGALLVVWLCSSTASAISYSVAGHFSYQLYTADREGNLIAHTPLNREFVLTVDDCNWETKIVLIGNTNYEYFRYAYDGTNMYYSSKLTPATTADLINSDTDTKKKFTNLLDVVTVEASPVPQGITSAGGEYVWLAFASGCYFQGLNEERAIWFDPLRSSTGLIQRHDLPCHFTLSSNAPFLPMQIQYRATNMEFLSPEGKIVKRDLPPPFQAGYMSAEFKVLATTNIDAYQFPTEFELREYDRRPRAQTTNDVFCAVLVHGILTSVTITDAVSNPVNTALTNGVVIVQDERLPGPAVSYKVMNSTLPPVDNPEVKKARDQVVKRIISTETNHRYIVLAVLVAVSGIFTIFIFRNKKTNRKESK